MHATASGADGIVWPRQATDKKAGRLARGQKGMQPKRILSGLIYIAAFAWAIQAHAATWSSGTINIPIPSDDDVRIQHSIVVGENVRLSDLTVVTAIDQTWVGDLVIWLEHPNGQVVTLMERAGIPPAHNFGNPADLSVDHPIRFSDTFMTPANDAGMGCHPEAAIGTDCPGDFRPQDSLLAAFGDLPTAGEWTLSITDFVFTHDGTLGWWSLEITGTPVPLPAALWLFAAGLGTLAVRRGGRTPQPGSIERQSG